MTGGQTPQKLKTELFQAKMKIYLIIAMLVLMNAFFIISNNDLALKDGENIKTFFSLYFDWVKDIGNNITELTGNIVKLDWVPGNTTGE